MMKQVLNAFPGYEFKYLEGDKNDGKKHNIYMDTDLGYGGYILGNPGIYGNVAMLDCQSLHPNSIVNMNYFGDYTERYAKLLKLRVLIKHGKLDEAKTLFPGELDEYLSDPDKASQLAQAIKIALNSCYGLTSASFDNPMRDSRNVNNIVALRGALFMRTLQDEIEKRGFIIVGIRTDSIKIADATLEIIQFCNEFAAKYNYIMEHECTYERICLVNKSAYIAKYCTLEQCENLYGKEYVHSDKDIVKDCKKHGGSWTATATQFQIPYVFKTLFSHEPLKIIDDVSETKTVKTALYLDMNENLTVQTGAEKELDKAISDCKKGLINDVQLDILKKELEPVIANGHDYKFVGKVGRFCPIKEGCGGGLLVAERDGKYNSVTGAKGYRWLEAEIVEQLHKENDIDYDYYEKLVQDAKMSISMYGNYDWFVSDDPYISPEFVDGHPVYPEELPF